MSDQIAKAVDTAAKIFMADVKQKAADFDRMVVLLRATHQLLDKQNKAHFVLNLLDTTVIYDEADCSGDCLMMDIEDVLGDRL